MVRIDLPVAVSRTGVAAAVESSNEDDYLGDTIAQRLIRG
jgi:hypothetical protein